MPVQLLKSLLGGGVPENSGGDLNSGGNSAGNLSASSAGGLEGNSAGSTSAGSMKSLAGSSTGNLGRDSRGHLSVSSAGTVGDGISKNASTTPADSSTRSLGGNTAASSTNSPAERSPLNSPSSPAGKIINHLAGPGVNISMNVVDYHLTLWLPNFAAQVLEIHQAELKGIPFVTTKQNPDYPRSPITATSLKDTANDIHAGDTVKEAKKLYPTLKVVKEEESLNKQMAQVIVKIAEEYAPKVSVDGKGLFCLDLSGTQRLYQKKLGVLQNDLIHRLERLGLKTIRTGSAHRKVVSLIVACRAHQQHLYCPPGGEEKLIHPLSTRYLPHLPLRTRGLLKDYNIQTIGECFKLSYTKLKSLFGEEGQKLFYLLRDEISEEQQTRKKGRRSIQVEVTLPQNVIDSHRLKREVKLLTERFLFLLRKEDKKTTALKLTLQYSDHKLSTDTYRWNQGCDNFQELLRRANELTRNAFSRRVSVQRLTLSSAYLQSNTHQTHLFEDAQQEFRQESLGRSLDKIRNKYEFESVVNGDILRKHSL